MLKAIRLAATATILFLGVALCVFALAESSAYRECISKAEQQPSSRSQNESPSQIFVTGIRFRCIGNFVDRNNAAITAISTVVVAIFTTILGIFTVSLAKSTRTAADAARRSADAAIALQLPIIRIAPDKLEHGDGMRGGEEFEECWVYCVTLSNLGATKAFPVEILYGWTIGETLQSEPNYRFVDRFAPNFILDPDPKATQPKRLTFAMPLKPGQWSEICSGNRLWFYCALLYDDFMGERHTHGFCWRWTNVGMGLDWRVDATPAYNRKT